MIYSFHHYNYWVKGGVETGLAYRAKIFRNLGLDAKFVFATTFQENNIWNETQALGFKDSEVIWMYDFFSDCDPSVVTYTLEQLENTFSGENYVFSRDRDTVKYQFPDLNIYYIAYMMDEKSNFVHRTAMISNGYMVRKDYYTYCRIYSEYYMPADKQAHLYLRRFFNKDGSVSYEEIIDGDIILYKFSDRMIYSREELVGYMMSGLHLTEKDVVLIDGEWGFIDREAFLQNASPAKTGVIIHTDHFVYSDDEHVLWYHWFEYIFSHPEKVDFFVTNTEAQSSLLREQFRRYKGLNVKVEAIPVACLDEIHVPKKNRKRHSIITAGRLHSDKHTDMIIEATVMAQKEITDLTLDIYGEGAREGELQALIDELNCGNYIHICGFQRLDDIYQNYEAYISASYGETFGITLLEAVGSGLSIVGFDIPYGIQVFVDEGKNGFVTTHLSAEALSECIIRLFTQADMDEFQKHSYEKARLYLTAKVEKKWKEILL
ncbi:MAG: glycosyltransferase [Ruminococcus sp.]|nr:glycosyltransferase [Ruminococcus sp.]